MIPLESPARLAEVAAPNRALLDLLVNAAAPATREAYQRDWVRWAAWCDRTSRVAFPAAPLDVASYLEEASRVERSGTGGSYAASTLSRWVAGIDAVHRASVDEHPGIVAPGQTAVVRRTLSAIRRRQAADRSIPARRQARPLSRSDLVAMLQALDFDHWPAGVAARRDAAVLLVGWVGARRSAEIAGIRVHDITWHPDHVQVSIPVSKTDQGGHGHVIVLPRANLEPVLCAPCALHRWLSVRAAVWAASHPPPTTADTALLAPSTIDRRQGEREMTAAMATVLERRGAADKDGHVCTTPPGYGPVQGEVIPLESRLVGYGPHGVFGAVHRTGRIADSMSGEVVTDIVRRTRTAAGLPLQGYSSHSLRAGFVTTADKGGADIMAIQQQTAHRTHESVALYRRRNNPSDGNAVHALGL